MRPRVILALVAIATLIGLLVYGTAVKGGSSLALGEPAPDRTFSQVQSGGEKTLADYRGHWVLLNFWASWCEPCRSEAPELESFSKAHQGRVQVVGVNLDDSLDNARAFVDRYQLTYPQLRQPDGSDLRSAYGMTGFPESFLVDPAGKIALIRRGPVDQRTLDSVLGVVGGR